MTVIGILVIVLGVPLLPVSMGRRSAFEVTPRFRCGRWGCLCRPA